MTGTEHVVAMSDSTPTRLATLNDIGAAPHSAGIDVAVDLDRLIALCSDSPAGAAFLSAGAGNLIAGIRDTLDGLAGDLSRLEIGWMHGTKALADADEGLR